MQGQTPPTSDKSPFAIGKRLHDSGNFEQAEQRPRQVIRDIHDACHGTAEAYGPPDNYLTGANVAGFERVAGAILVHALDPSRAIPADRRVGWVQALRPACAHSSRPLPDEGHCPFSPSCRQAIM